MNDERPPQTPMSSPAHDIRKLKQNGTAAVGELKEFLGKIRGKNPKEMLGVVASSGLVQGFIQATIAMTVLVLALTAVPYAWGQMFGKGGSTAPATETAETASQQPPPESGETTPDPGKANPQTPATPADPLANQADIADKLGVGEQKDAPANSNPLENATDDLLKGLD